MHGNRILAATLAATLFCFLPWSAHAQSGLIEAGKAAEAIPKIRAALSAYRAGTPLEQVIASLRKDTDVAALVRAVETNSLDLETAQRLGMAGDVTVVMQELVKARAVPGARPAERLSCSTGSCVTRLAKSIEAAGLVIGGPGAETVTGVGAEPRVLVQGVRELKAYMADLRAHPPEEANGFVKPQFELIPEAGQQVILAALNRSLPAEALQSLTTEAPELIPMLYGIYYRNGGGAPNITLADLYKNRDGGGAFQGYSMQPTLKSRIESAIAEHITPVQINAIAADGVDTAPFIANANDAIFSAMGRFSPPYHPDNPIEVAMIGLGTMGQGMAKRLIDGGHTVRGYAGRPGEPDVESMDALASYGGIKGGNSALETVQAMPADKPRVIWLMVPYPAVDSVIAEIKPALRPGDIIVDGGNSPFKSYNKPSLGEDGVLKTETVRGTMERAAELEKDGIYFVDVGTSGGQWGYTNGYGMMVGGDEKAVEVITPALETLAPGKNESWARMGGPGTGHATKMVHNGIEYGQMASIVEGLAVLESIGVNPVTAATVWGRGTIVDGFLMDVTRQGMVEFSQDGKLDLSSFSTQVGASGEGNWTVALATELNVPVPTIAAALQARFMTQTGNGYPGYVDREGQMLQLMRYMFGGHAPNVANGGVASGNFNGGGGN